MWNENHAVEALPTKRQHKLHAPSTSSGSKNKPGHFATDRRVGPHSARLTRRSSKTFWPAAAQLWTAPAFPCRSSQSSFFEATCRPPRVTASLPPCSRRKLQLVIRVCESSERQSEVCIRSTDRAHKANGDTCLPCSARNYRRAGNGYCCSSHALHGSSYAEKCLLMASDPSLSAARRCLTDGA